MGGDTRRVQSRVEWMDMYMGPETKERKEYATDGYKTWGVERVKWITKGGVLRRDLCSAS
jgi:hypothetical protein